MLTTVDRLFESLHDRGVRYCHWKSNERLVPALGGEGDIDLLVGRQDAGALRAILLELGFRPAIEAGIAPFPSVEHYLALDEPSGRLVHVHVYFRIISGESLAKNYRFPLEELLLSEVERSEGVDVPARGAELLVFVLRIYLKHATLTELMLLMRGWEEVRREAAWLATGDARAEAQALLPVAFPRVDGDLFARALDGLLAPASLPRRVLTGRRIRARLKPYARRGRLAAWLAGMRDVGSRAAHRLRGTRKGLAPASGGAVIAFVGAEASGKSTLLLEIERWLKVYFAVERIHAGKPPATPLTVLPNLLLPALRRLLPKQRSTRVSERVAVARETQTATGPFPLAFGVRSVLLAHDRRALLRRAYARSANGGIVLCDRYPSAELGSLDGAQLGAGDSDRAVGRPRRWLAAVEARLYSDIPAPDQAIQLRAPLEVTMERNRTREKREPEDYVRARYQRSERIHFDGVRLVRVDTDRPLEETLRDVKRIIWDAL